MRGAWSEGLSLPQAVTVAHLGFCKDPHSSNLLARRHLQWRTCSSTSQRPDQREVGCQLCRDTAVRVSELTHPTITNRIVRAIFAFPTLTGEGHVQRCCRGWGYDEGDNETKDYDESGFKHPHCHI